MHVAVLQHAAFETLGAAEVWLQSQKASVSLVALYEPDHEFPLLETLDLIIVLGGPMNLDQEDEYPWLVDEKIFIRKALDANIPMLGICLGAQHISLALGGQVTQNKFPEIGWFPVRGLEVEKGKFQMPNEKIFLEWHGQTYSLPEGAVQLAYSEACPQQAFQWKERTIGVQFHPEYTPQLVIDTIAELSGDLEEEEFVQSAETISSAPPEYYENAHQFLFEVLDYLVRDE